MRINSLFLTVLSDFFSIHPPASVLPANDKILDLAFRNGPQSMKYLGFLITILLLIEFYRRFHRAQGQKLQYMVLKHVPQHPGFIIIGRAVLYAKRFRGHDLDMVDVAPVPNRLKNGVGKTE